MTSSHYEPSRPARRIRQLAIFIAIAIGFYTAGWYYFANTLTEQTSEAITRINASGARANCENLEARGYPFRMGLYCDSVVYENTGEGVFITAGAVRSAAQIYRPAHVRSEMDAPAHIEVPGFVPLELDWEWLGSSTRLAQPLPERVSLATRKFSVAVADGYSFETGALFKAGEAEAHMRPNGPDIELAASALEATIPRSGADQMFDVHADIMIEDGIARIANISDLRGLAGEIRRIVLQAKGGGSIAISGPLFVDQEGLVNGELTIEITDGEKLGEAIAAIVPQAADRIKATLGAGQPDENGKSQIPIRINKGKVFAGFFPIAEIPAL